MIEEEARKLKILKEIEEKDKLYKL